MVVTLNVVRSNGETVTDAVIVPELEEDAAVCRALDAAALAYPNARSIMWDSVGESETTCDEVQWI